ncbi:MAG: AMP-binding protein [Pseudomonadota bacterium]
MNLAHWLHRTAQVHGARDAVLIGTENVADYATLHTRAAALAGALEIKPGDRVGLFLANCPEFLITFWAVWIAGGVVVPINNKLHGREAAWILEHAGAVRAFVTPKLGAALAGETNVPMTDVSSPAFEAMTQGRAMDIIPRTPDDLAWLFYTSGTTGRPKGVQITHGMLEAMTLSYFVDVDAVTAEDATLFAAPMSHAAGIYHMMYTLKGAQQVCPPSGGFDAEEVLDLSIRLGSVCLFMAPTMVRRFTDVAKARGDRAEGIRTIIYAGGPMYNADIIEAVDWFGPKFVQIYGQGECLMAITALSREDVADRSHPRWRDRLGSVGRAQSVVEVAIGDAEGAVLPPGETGEIMVRGRPVTPGYWLNPEATATTLVDGWLRTGDVGRLDEDGYLTLTDRSKDMIISGGSNIYPREVEEVLLEHPDVHEVSVVGRKDADWGEVVCAFVVTAPEAQMDEAALDAHCTANIARFKRPKLYRAIPALPKNNYGKVLKTELRARLEAEA